MKRKAVKRLMAMMLIAAMATGAAGCGNNDAGKESGGADSKDKQSSEASKSSAGGEESSSASEDGELGKYTVLTDKDGNTIDLGGMHIIMRDWWTNPDNVQENKSAYDEAREEYLEWIQETYNFTIEQKAISDWGSTPEDFTNYVITNGDDENYLFFLRADSTFLAAMNNGLMWDLTKLDSVDFSESKWDKGVKSTATKGSAIYAMNGEYTEPKGGMFFNKRVLEDAGINPDEIYQLQENMEWTWAKFEELCEKVAADTDNDGVIDRYALASFSAEWFPEAVYSNGGHFINMDADGKLYNDLESETTIEALNWALDMWEKYDGHSYYPEDANWDYWMTAFTEGKAGFMARETYTAGNQLNGTMKDDYGYVCFPMGPKMSDYANVSNSNPVVIPACYDEDKAWKLAFAYNLWTDPVPGFGADAAWKYNYYKAFRDTEAVDYTIARLVTNGYSTYHAYVPGIDLGADLIWSLNKDNTPAQQAEVVRPKWESFLAEVNK